MENLLKDKKLSETPFRKEILSIFKKYDNAIPLSIIETNLKEYNRITLYRTIKIFLEKGIIHEIALSGEDSSYAICKDKCNSAKHQHKHVHFKCSQCDTLSCVEIGSFPSINIPGYEIEDMEIQLKGICSSCKI